MHCNICDKQLTDKEISWNEDLGTFEPCTTCLDIAMEAAYSGQFQTEDDEFIVLDEFDGADWAYQDWSYLAGDQRITE